MDLESVPKDEYIQNLESRIKYLESEINALKRHHQNCQPFEAVSNPSAPPSCPHNTHETIKTNARLAEADHPFHIILEAPSKQVVKLPAKFQRWKQEANKILDAVPDAKEWESKWKDCGIDFNKQQDSFVSPSLGALMDVL